MEFQDDNEDAGSRDGVRRTTSTPTTVGAGGMTGADAPPVPTALRAPSASHGNVPGRMVATAPVAVHVAEAAAATGEASLPAPVAVPVAEAAEATGEASFPAPVAVPVAEAAAATGEASLPAANSTRDADAQLLDSLVADTCKTFFWGGASPPRASLLGAVERATAVAVRLIAPHKDLPVDPVVASATVLKLRALVWPVADRPDVMSIFSRALCTALRSAGGVPVLTLPANVVAPLLSAMVLPVTHPDAWVTGAQLSVLAVCATTTTTTTTTSGLPTGARGRRVDQRDVPLLPRASGAGDQARQPLPTAPGFLGESVVEAVCLLLLSGLRNGTLVEDFVGAGDILRFLSMAWCSGCRSSAAATNALAALVTEDSSRVVHLALAGDSVGESHHPNSRVKLCTGVWREMSQAMSTSMHGATEQDAHGPAARALAMVVRPSMCEMLSLPGILAFVPAATPTQIPGFGSWSAAVVAYVSQLLRGVTAVLCNPSLEENDEVVTHLSAAVYTLAGTGLGLLLSSEKSLRKAARLVMCQLTSWYDPDNSSIDVVPEDSKRADDERRSWSPDVLLRLCKSVARMTAVDEATVQGDQELYPTTGPLFIFALALDAALRLVHVAAARDLSSEESTPLQSLAVCTAFVRACDAFVAALPMGDATILASTGGRGARTRLVGILARLLDEGRGRIPARTPASVIGNLRRLLLRCVCFLASEAWERPEHRAFKRAVADAWFDSLPWVWCLAFGGPGTVAREAATAAEFYWTAVGRRGQRGVPATLSVSRTTMASTTSRLLQAHDRGQLLVGGATLLNVLTNVQRTLFVGKVVRDLRELRSTVHEIIGNLEGGQGARHRGGSGTNAARHVHAHTREPGRVRTSGSGTMEDPIEIIDDDEEAGLVALPPESASAQAFNVQGVDLTHGLTAHPVRGGTVPVTGVQPGAADGGRSSTPRELTDVGDLPELSGRLAQRKAMGVFALLTSTSSWKTVSSSLLDDGEDAEDATGSAAEWRRRVLRLVTTKASLTVSTVADEMFWKDGGDRGPRGRPVSVQAPTAHLYALYGRSLALAATHTEAEQAGTVDVLILVQEHPLQIRADESTDDDGDDNDRRVRQPTYAANASPGDLCNIWVPVPDASVDGNKGGKETRGTYSTSIDAVCVSREAVTKGTALQGRGSGSTKATPLWFSVRRTDAHLLPCATKMAGLVVVTLSMSIVSDWREYSGLGEWMRLPRTIRESLEPPVPTGASSVVVPGTSSPVILEPWPNAQPPPPPPPRPPPPPPPLDIAVELDESQLGVVRTVADAFGGPRVSCVLVTGPPGTGKTRTILGVAMELIRRGCGCGDLGPIMTRLLLVSRTNAACDQIVSALLSLHALLERHDWGRRYLKSLSQAFGSVAGARMPVLFRVGLAPPKGDPIAATHIDAVVKDLLPRVYPDVVRRQEAAAAAHEALLQSLGASGSNDPTSVRDAQAAGDELVEANAAVKKSVRRLHSQVAQGAPIVVTTTATSTGNAIGDLGYHVIIVDEAASTSIPAAVSAVVRAAGEGGDEAARMTRCVVFMGDPAQLPPSSGMRYTGDLIAMGDSVFEWLQRDHPQLTLTHQHRLRPIFWTIVRGLFYSSIPVGAGMMGNKASWDNAVPLRPDWLVRASRRPLEITSTSQLPPQDRQEDFNPDTKGVSNLVEVRVVEDELRNILRGWASRPMGDLRVLVLSPYTAQRRLLDAAVRRVRATIRRPPQTHYKYTVDVATVDGSQGASVDCVFLSLARSIPRDDQQTRSRMMRFTGDRRRMNVMLSRAEAHLHVVRDMDYVAQSNTPWDAWWAGVLSGRWGGANLVRVSYVPTGRGGHQQGRPAPGCL
ncbi:hypothetical protein I4F81_010086 [Pyropia yezoensis]|uniref:Uncharacterized protein n=1 Tax=Pyropia yezoensis TaxID=2788 RepID=A0ACC3CBV1_PYRYE|nr:hypothetical protein I4F81_010086 [Neopyropia yezoensis]